MDLYTIQPPITIPHQKFDLESALPPIMFDQLESGKGSMSFLLGDGRLMNLTKATKFHE